jgi:hypothetical protein
MFSGADIDGKVMHALFPTKDSIAEYTEWYKEKCKALLAEKSFS